MKIAVTAVFARARGMKENGTKLITSNRKARRDYHVLETFEAGLVLVGITSSLALLKPKICFIIIRHHQIPR